VHAVVADTGPIHYLLLIEHIGVLPALFAAALSADLLLMDDRQGTRIARKKGFRVIGTLRVLDLAARRSLLDLAEAFERIKRSCSIN